MDLLKSGWYAKFSLKLWLKGWSFSSLGPEIKQKLQDLLSNVSQIDSNIIFRTSNKHEHIHLKTVELRTNIKWTLNILTDQKMYCKAVRFLLLFSNCEMRSIQSDLGNSYQVLHKELFTESFSSNTFSKVFKIVKNHWISTWNRIFYGNIMFTKCSSNSTIIRISNGRRKCSTFGSRTRTPIFVFEH